MGTATAGHMIRRFLLRAGRMLMNKTQNSHMEKSIKGDVIDTIPSPILFVEHGLKTNTMRPGRRQPAAADATHPHYNSFPNSMWILKGTDKELPVNSGRQRLNFNGAVDMEGHQAIVISFTCINRLNH